MKHYGAFEAKMHFSEILGDVINGESFVITKHGVRVALIIPFTQREKGTDPINEAIRSIKKLRRGVILGKKLSVRKMREVGRK